MALVTVKQIALRLGVARRTAWAHSRQGRYGQPVDRSRRCWKWEDDATLEMMLASCGPRPPVRNRCDEHHARRLADFATGTRTTADEDLQLASALLEICARMIDRRSAGLPVTCSISAKMVCARAGSKKLAGDATVPERLRTVGAALAELAKSGNATTAPEE
jgi:hypothetical protein